LQNPEFHSLGTVWFSDMVSQMDLSSLAHVRNIDHLRLSQIDYIDLGFLRSLDFPRSLSLSRVPEYLVDSVFFHRDTFRVLTISRMNDMTALSDYFPNLRHVQSSLRLLRNDQLNDVGLLQGFNLPDLPLVSWRDPRVQILDNPSLRTCNVEYLCEAIEVFPSDRVWIDRNGIFCHEDTLQRYGCMTVSVDHDLSPNAEVYPNPFGDVLSIDHYSGRVMILDLLGRPVSFHVVSYSDQLDVSSLLPGVYIVRLEDEGGPVDMRVVKSQ
jgi:hypothetical protein